MTNHSGGGTPRTDEAYVLGLLGRIADLECELTAAQSALAEKEREVERMKIDFDLLAEDVETLNKLRRRAELAEARAGELEDFKHGRMTMLYEVAQELSEQLCAFLNDEKPFDAADAAVKTFHNNLAAPPASPTGRKE
jgi:hypothetical protein